MGEHLSYEGQDLGKICHDDTNTGKLVFVANGLDCLITLFSVSGEIETESKGRIPYEKFKEEYLANISGFYPTQEAWLLKNERAKTLAEYEAVSGS